jgi:DNA-binding NarL/FixJ family response regulator
MSSEPRVRLLVIDDFPAISTLVVRALAGTEFDVVGTAETGAEGVLLAQTLQPDIVLLDRQLPDDMCYRTLKTLIQSGLRVIIFSGDAGPTNASEARELGACGYVGKGKSMTNLIRALRLAASVGSFSMAI